MLLDLPYNDLIAGFESEEYADVHFTLQFVCRMLNICHFYVYDMSDKDTASAYYFAVAGDEWEDNYIDTMLESGDDLVHGLNQEQQSLLGNVDPDPVITPHENQNDLTWCFPVYVMDRDDPLVMRIDVDDKLITTRIFDNTLSFAVPMIVIEIIVVFLSVGMLKRNVSNPLRVVSEHMRGFVQNGTTHVETLTVGKDDEISEIAESYNKMTGDISSYVKQIESMTQERVAAATELSVAQRIQQGLVPPTTERSGKGFEAFAFLRMARAVGGDFYTLSELSDGRIVFLLADVSGKGMSAALFMAMSNTLLIEKLRSIGDPAQALNEANDIIASNNPENMFVTLVAGFFDPSTGVLTYANAGHTRPLVVGSGYLDPDPGIALGLFEDAGIVNETIELKPGEGVLFYTDGAPEAIDASKSFFGEERLAKAVEGMTHPKDTIFAAVNAIDDFAAGSEQFDDLTLLSVFAQ